MSHLSTPRVNWRSLRTASSSTPQFRLTLLSFGILTDHIFCSFHPGDFYRTIRRVSTSHLQTTAPHPPHEYRRQWHQDANMEHSEQRRIVQRE